MINNRLPLNLDKISNILLIFIFVILLPMSIYVSNMKINLNGFEKLNNLNPNISIRYTRSNKIEEVTLPTHIVTDEPFEVLVKLDDLDKIQNKTLATDIAYMDFTMIVDDKKIASYPSLSDSIPKSGGYGYYFATLPSNIEKPLLTIQFTPKLQYMNSYELNMIYFGDSESFLLGFIFMEFISIFLIIVLIVAFFILLTMYISSYSISKKNGNIVDASKLLNIGILALLVAMYYTFNLNLTKYILYNNKTLLYFGAYFSFCLLLTPFLKFVKGSLDKRFNKFFTLMVVLQYFNFIVQTLLTINKITEYKDMLPISQILQLISLSLIFIAILKTDSKKYPEKTQTIISVSPIFLNSLLTYVLYFLFGRLAMSNFILFDTLFFIIIQIYYLVKQYISMQQHSIEREVYEKILRFDTLTGLGSRYSFEEHIKDIESNPRDLSLIVVDMNNLKYINDRFGHAYGDIAIINAGKVLKKYLPTCDIYRIGGDEYVIICEKQNIDLKVLDKIKNQKIYIQGLEDKHTTSLSIGYIQYSKNSSISISEHIKMADRRMYLDKSKTKQYPYFC